LVEDGPPLLSSDSKIAYWALINDCRLEQQDLSKAGTKIMKSRGSQDPYVQEAILSVTDINCQIIQLQTRINEILWFPCTALYLMLPLDQREEGLIRVCIKRQGSLYLLLDYEPAAEDEGNSCNFLDLDIPLTLHDLTKFSDEQFKSSSAYRQESNTPSDQVKPSYPEETTCTQNEDSSMGSSQEVEDWTPEERQQDYNPKTSKEKEEDDSSPFHEEKSNKDLKPESGIGVES
jgi:hypothetical protein